MSPLTVLDVLMQARQERHGNRSSSVSGSLFTEWGSGNRQLGCRQEARQSISPPFFRKSSLSLSVSLSSSQPSLYLRHWALMVSCPLTGTTTSSSKAYTTPPHTRVCTYTQMCLHKCLTSTLASFCIRTHQAHAQPKTLSHPPLLLGILMALAS